MTRVLVTGATGFVGQVLCESLARSGYVVRAALRTERQMPRAIAETVVSGDLCETTVWEEALRDVDLVVHAAARAHVYGDEPLARAHNLTVNAVGTGCLARAAAGSGVRRFVYLSTIKVNGETTSQRAFLPGDPPGPRDDYAKSKLQGETLLLRAAADTGMEAVIVRPPLVYGPAVRANFLRLMRWIDGGWPLPLGAIRNQRSLVSIWNLCDLIETLLARPTSAAGVWLVSDGEDPSTPDLVRRLGRALQRSVRLVAVPVPLLRAAAALTGRSAEAARLCDSLTVSIAATRTTLGWSPPVPMDEALRRTAAWYRASGPGAG